MWEGGPFLRRHHHHHHYDQPKSFSYLSFTYAFRTPDFFGFFLDPLRFMFSAYRLSIVPYRLRINSPVGSFESFNQSIYPRVAR